MNLLPRPKDVVQFTGHTRHEGRDLHGMIGFVDIVEDKIATLHVDNMICGIHAAIKDLEVLYRIGHR